MVHLDTPSGYGSVCARLPSAAGAAVAQALADHPMRAGQQAHDALALALVAERARSQRSRHCSDGRQPAVIPRRGGVLHRPGGPQVNAPGLGRRVGRGAAPRGEAAAATGVWEVLAQTLHGRALSKRTAAAAAHRSHGGRTRPRAAAAAHKQPSQQTPPDDRYCGKGITPAGGDARALAVDSDRSRCSGAYARNWAIGGARLCVRWRVRCWNSDHARGG